MDGKNHLLANPHKGLFRLDDIITPNPEMLTLKDTVQRVAANTFPCSFGERPVFYHKDGKNHLPSHKGLFHSHIIPGPEMLTLKDTVQQGRPTPLLC